MRSIPTFLEHSGEIEILVMNNDPSQDVAAAIGEYAADEHVRIVEMGWEAGIAQYGAFADGPDATVVRRQVHRVLVSSDLSPIERAVVLLEVARALLHPADTGPDTSKAG